jgi:hypothetical protein
MNRFTGNAVKNATGFSGLMVMQGVVKRAGLGKILVMLNLDRTGRGRVGRNRRNKNCICRQQNARLEHLERETRIRLLFGGVNTSSTSFLRRC